ELRLEGEAVEVRLDVDRGAGIAVVVPGAADAVALLEDHEVVETRAPQLDRGAEPTGPRADDRDPSPVPVPRRRDLHAAAPRGAAKSAGRGPIRAATRRRRSPSRP